MNNYTISFCERPVTRGQALDKQVLGKPLSHPFLVLKNSNNQVLKELHGSWSPTFGNKQTSISKIFELTLAGSALIDYDTKLHNIFNELNLKHRPVNRMIASQNCHQYPRAKNEIELKSGSFEEMSYHWGRAQKHAKYIDALRLPYVRYAHGDGVNCQVTMKTVMYTSHLTKDQDIELELGDSGWSSSNKKGGVLLAPSSII